jgi:nifR3 family TIM-barrel protein
MQIADIKIKNKVFLAPMAGVTDRIYRQIIKRFGCGLVYSEMVSAQAINMHNKKTIDMLEINNDERPVAIQIFGSNAAEFVKAATFVETTYHPDIIDINMGCPVPKIAIKSQAGSALMKNPNKIKNILIAVTAAIKTPITIKIRSGWDENSINAVAVAKIAQECGVSAITVHPRTRKQGYSGLAD